MKHTGERGNLKYYENSTNYNMRGQKAYCSCLSFKKEELKGRPNEV